jgi:hypothetical protein
VRDYLVTFHYGATSVQVTVAADDERRAIDAAAWIVVGETGLNVAGTSGRAAGFTATADAI